jgi:excisionase family DNA binding protein
LFRPAKTNSKPSSFRRRIYLRNACRTRRFEDRKGREGAPESVDIAAQFAQHRGGMNVHEVSELTSIAVSTLYQMVRDNRIPVVKIGAKWIFDPARMAAWWRSKEVG